MKNIQTSLVDEHLQSLQGMKEVEPDNFFYTRLKAKMMTRQGIEKISLHWIYATVTVMLLLLAVNVFIWRNANTSNESNSSIQQLVQEYGWVRHDIYSDNSN